MSSVADFSMTACRNRTFQYEKPLGTVAMPALGWLRSLDFIAPMTALVSTSHWVDPGCVYPFDAVGPIAHKEPSF